MTSHPNSFPVLVGATVASHLVIVAYQSLFLCNLRLFPFPGIHWNLPCRCTSACSPTQLGSLYTLDHEVDEIRALELCKETMGCVLAAAALWMPPRHWAIWASRFPKVLGVLPPPVPNVHLGRESRGDRGRVGRRNGNTLRKVGLASGLY